VPPVGPHVDYMCIPWVPYLPPITMAASYLLSSFRGRPSFLLLPSLRREDFVSIMPLVPDSKPSWSFRIGDVCHAHYEHTRIRSNRASYGLN
jgi:hypothetical protein